MVALITSKTSLSNIIYSPMLLSSVPFGNVFKLYVCLLLIMPALLLVRIGWRAPGLLAAIVAIWVVHYFVLEGLPKAPSPLSHMGGFLIGAGDTFGPSVFHSLAFMAAGMIAADAIFTKQTKAAKPAFLIIVVVSTAIFILEGVNVGLRDLLYGIADITIYRQANSPVYFSYGILVSCALLAAASLSMRVWDTSSDPKKSTVEIIGGATFPYFFIGNVVLLLVPSVLLSGVSLAVAVTVYVILATALTKGWLRYGRTSAVWSAYNSALTIIATKVHQLVKPTQMRVRLAKK